MLAGSGITALLKCWMSRPLIGVSLSAAFVFPSINQTVTTGSIQYHFNPPPVTPSGGWFTIDLTDSLPGDTISPTGTDVSVLAAGAESFSTGARIEPRTR